MDRRAFVLALSALTASRPLEMPPVPKATPKWRLMTGLDPMRDAYIDQVGRSVGRIERFNFVTSPLL